jgi:hypothetical protein
MLWAFFTGHGTCAALICWRRTGLPYATAAMVAGTAALCYLAELVATGRVLPHVPASWWIPVAIGCLFVPVLLFEESRTHPAKVVDVAKATIFHGVACFA